MNAFEWAQSSEPQEPPSDFYCPASDVWQGRFVKVGPLLVNKKFEPNIVALFTGAIGEIGDNCFTHNAPGWVDISGCWFECHLDGATFSCVIADRGGVFLPRFEPHVLHLRVIETHYGWH